jgi:osmoprotectant transport system permease protein
MVGESWLAFVVERLPELWLRVGEHLMLTGFSTAAAVLIGIPLGILAARIGWLRGPLTGTVGIMQTIPSLAMLAILLALLQKIGAVPAIIALTMYALLPIVRNTLAGLENVSPDVIEAARGIGMTPRQRLWLVEIPLSRSVIIAGIRTAAVVGVGIATLSAFIGAGGLGQFINRGLALSNTNLILMGAIPAALLALLVDGSIAAFQWGLISRRGHGSHLKVVVARYLRPVALSLPLLIFAGGFLAFLSGNQSSSAPNSELTSDHGNIRIGTKNFTEQLILGELMAQLIETHTDLSVTRRFNLGGTMICHQALANGEIDLYAEYTGTALMAVLGISEVNDGDLIHEVVAAQYQNRFQATWLAPFGFNNTYAITVRKSFSDSTQLQTISDLKHIAPNLRAGFTAEFSERPDGYLGLRHTYGLEFREVRDLDPALMYQAVVNGEIDVICAFATDGRISAYKLQPLKDDLNFFPPYQAAPVVRTGILNNHPDLSQILGLLAGVLDDRTMQQLNYKVDSKQQPIREVAYQFLADNELLAGKE